MFINIEFRSCWSSGNAFVTGAGGQKFKSRAGQFGNNIANGSPPLRHFFLKKLCLKVNLHRIHLTSVFVHFFTFLFLEKVWAFSSAFL